MKRCAPLVFCLLLAGCAGHRPHSAPGTAEAGTRTLADADTVSYAEQLAACAARPAADRLDARERAEAVAARWRDFEREAREDFDSRFRHWYSQDQQPTLGHSGVGLLNSILDLRAATAIDPSFAEAWAALGRLTLEAGDPASARRHLDNACLAVGIEAAAGRSLDPEALLGIHRDRAWALRDLAEWDAGLAAAEEGLRLRSGDPELLLIKGLLLADSGRYLDAMALAARMPALQYPRYDFTYRGLKRQASTFANNWIRAQALLARGRVDDAYWILGDLDLYAYRGLLPFAPRYWRDAALIAELHGDPKAPLYYAVGYVTRPYQRFYPVSAHNVAPLVLDVPDPHMPVYLGLDMRFYVAGSPLTYVGTQVNSMAGAVDEQERLQAGGRALRMIDVLEKRHVLPGVCRALRGRILYAGGDFEQARSELEAARASFGAANRVDAGTSLVLGLLCLRDGDWAAAVTTLTEASDADPGSALALRSLGVALTKSGELERAGQAMDRAVALDPLAVAAWYNRGLLNLQRERFAAAVADLDQALRLEPESREVQRLLQMAAASLRAEGGANAAFDSLLSRTQTELAGTFAVPDSLRAGVPDADRRFRALAAAYAAGPRPEWRLPLALAYLDRNLLDALQALLAPGWGKDLTPAEELMLLWADRSLGEAARAEQATRELLAAGPGAGNPYVLAMAADTMRTSTDPVGTDHTTPGIHGYFGWWRDAKMSYGADPRAGGMRIVGYAADLFARYRSEPMFEQAVWGLPATPLGTGSFRVGAAAGGKDSAR